MDWNNLNRQQQDAVRATEGYVRVIAGAGSGKTRVLTERYIYLVQEKKVAPERILAVTFTRKAAKEIQTRITNTLGELSKGCHIQTFHSFSLAFLKEEIGVLGYSHGFKVMDQDMQIGLFKKIAKTFGLDYQPNLYYEYAEKINEYKSHSDYMFRLMNHAYPTHILDKVSNEDETFIDAYLLLQRKYRWLDFSDLIFFTDAILKRYPTILSKWQDRFQYVEIDEGQDTSLVEMDIMEKMAGKCQNLFLVGDPDQNIYEWRQSDNNILLNFNKKHQDAKTFLLTTNYRSVKNILDASNELIAHNKNRIAKALVNTRPLGQKIRIYKVYNDQSCAEIIQNLILESRARGEKFEDNAVLYRCNYNSQAMETLLKKNCLPYEIVGGVSFYELIEIKDAISFIKFLGMDEDESLENIINKPARKFGKKKLDYLLSIQKEKSLYETLKEHYKDPAFKGSTIEDFIHVIEQVKAKMTVKNVYQTLVDALEQTGYLDYIKGLKDKSHWDNLSSFLDTVKAYSEKNPKEKDLAKYYTDSLIGEAGNVESKDRIQLMTIHAAKGLEFKNVYVMGFDKNNFPHHRTLEERGENGLEEERRLCYVSMTRAKDFLALFHSEYNVFDMKQPASSFLKEIPKKLVDFYDENWLVQSKSDLDSSVKSDRKNKKQKKEKEKAKELFDSLFSFQD